MIEIVIYITELRKTAHLVGTLVAIYQL